MAITDNQEINTIQKMIHLYCRGNHKHLRAKNHCSKQDLCPECSDLFTYALQQIDRCPIKETKDFCSNCTVHCYRSDMREQIRTVMRYSGPRMLWHDPIMAIKHLRSSRKSKS